MNFTSLLQLTQFHSLFIASTHRATTCHFCSHFITRRFHITFTSLFCCYKIDAHQPYITREYIALKHFFSSHGTLPPPHISGVWYPQIRTRPLMTLLKNYCFHLHSVESTVLIKHCSAHITHYSAQSQLNYVQIHLKLNLIVLVYCYLLFAHYIVLICLHCPSTQLNKQCPPQLVLLFNLVLLIEPASHNTLKTTIT